MRITLTLASVLVASTSAFVSNPLFGIRGGATSSSSSLNEMTTIAEGVEFDTLAREWRCKWSPEADKASLVAAQKALEAVLDELKSVDGVQSVERVVCGGCMDFKVVTSLPADKFANWEKTGFYPEEEFLDMLESIDDLSLIETQTYTKMSV